MCDQTRGIFWSVWRSLPAPSREVAPKLDIAEAVTLLSCAFLWLSVPRPPRVAGKPRFSALGFLLTFLRLRSLGDLSV